jgi:hypothetical protein
MSTVTIESRGGIEAMIDRAGLDSSAVAETNDGSKSRDGGGAPSLENEETCVQPRALNVSPTRRFSSNL